MALAYRHEQLAPNLHRFLFPSASRPGVVHELLLDLDAEGADRLSCLCEAALHGKFCKHKRMIVRGEFGRRARLGRGSGGAAAPARKQVAKARSREAAKTLYRHSRLRGFAASRQLASGRRERLTRGPQGAAARAAARWLARRGAAPRARRPPQK